MIESPTTGMQKLVTRRQAIREGLRIGGNKVRDAVTSEVAEGVAKVALGVVLVTAIANELSQTPTVEAIEGFNDRYHTDTWTVDRRTNTLHSVITNNGEQLVATAKISGGRIGQVTERFSGEKLESDPKKILNASNSARKAFLSESGQRLGFTRKANLDDDEPIFLPIKATKAAAMDSEGQAVFLQGEDGQRTLVTVDTKVVKLTARDNAVQFTGISELKKVGNDYKTFASSANGLFSVEIDPTGKETTRPIAIPGVSGEVANLKNVDLPGGRKGLVFSNGRKLFIVDANDPTQVLRTPVEISGSHNVGSRITGIDVNKYNWDIAVATYCDNKYSAGNNTIVESINADGSRNESTHFNTASGQEKRPMGRETDVYFMYDETDLTAGSPRAYEMTDSFQQVFKAKNGGRLPEVAKVVPMEDPNKVLPTSTTRPTDTPRPTVPPTSTSVPPTPTKAPTQAPPSEYAQYGFISLDKSPSNMAAVVQTLTEGLWLTQAQLQNGRLVLQRYRDLGNFAFTYPRVAFAPGNSNLISLVHETGNDRDGYNLKAFMSDDAFAHYQEVALRHRVYSGGENWYGPNPSYTEDGKYLYVGNSYSFDIFSGDWITFANAETKSKVGEDGVQKVRTRFSKEGLVYAAYANPQDVPWDAPKPAFGEYWRLVPALASGNVTPVVEKRIITDVDPQYYDGGTNLWTEFREAGVSGRKGLFETHKGTNASRPGTAFLEVNLENTKLQQEFMINPSLGTGDLFVRGLTTGPQNENWYIRFKKPYTRSTIIDVPGVQSNDESKQVKVPYDGVWNSIVENTNAYPGNDYEDVHLQGVINVGGQRFLVASVYPLDSQGNFKPGLIARNVTNGLSSGVWEAISIKR